MGRPSTSSIDPTRIVIERARAYAYKDKYPQVVVFTKSLVEIDRLKSVFGGNDYVHGTGYIWMLSKRALILEMVEKTKPFFPSENGFEDLLRQYLSFE